MAGDVKLVQKIGVYLNNKLIVEIEQVKYTHTTNTEQGHGWDGALYFSKGNPVTSLDFTTITPKAGHEATSLKAAVINQTPVTFALTVDGGIEYVKGVLSERAYDSGSEKGMTKCSWKFMGGEPTVM